jgi:hypothetical protein
MAHKDSSVATAVRYVDALYEREEQTPAYLIQALQNLEIAARGIRLKLEEQWTPKMVRRSR